MEEILYSDDPFWKDPSRVLHDPKRIAWIEVEDRVSLAKFLPGTPPTPAESVTVVESESNPQRVVLEANLARPGLVILADVFYPGWTLTVDNKPSTILRANRAMRGAAVEAGKHRLVYTYNPRSFRLGGEVRPGLDRRPHRIPRLDRASRVIAPGGLQSGLPLVGSALRAVGSVDESGPIDDIAGIEEKVRGADPTEPLQPFMRRSLSRSTGGSRRRGGSSWRGWSRWAWRRSLARGGSG